MEIVRFAGLIYRSTKIPASHVALLSSIQVNDRADVALLGASGFSLMSSPAPHSGLSRSDLVLWPAAEVSEAASHFRFLGRTGRSRRRLNSSRMPSGPREFHPEPLTDAVHEPLDPYASCHRADA